MPTYLIQLNAGTLQTLEAAAITSLQLHYVSNGVDTLTLTKKWSLLSGIVQPYAYGDIIRLFYRDPLATPTDKCVFVGKIETLPLQADPLNTGSTYIAKGPTFDLQRCDYSQSWYYRNALGELAQDFDPNVCLCDNNGNRITTGQQIAAVVNYAATRGLNVATGTIAPGMFAPYDQKSNITCWDAVIAMLRFTPDHVVWWDYDNKVSGAYVPALNATASTAMPAVMLAHNALNQISLSARHDLVVPGIQVIFDMTSTVDSQTYRSRSLQTAGDHTHPRRLSLLYPLDGFHSTTQKQPIEVEAYPPLGTDAATKSWAHANVLWLRRLIYTEWKLKSVTRSGSLALPNRLTKGSAPDWLERKVDFEEENITLKVEYTVKNAGGTAIKKETKDITIKVTSTAAVSKTYTRQGSFQSAEEEPTNFAADLYASWSVLHYAGSLGLKQQTPSPSLRPGQVINVTGAVAAWATMAAIIQDTTINLPSGQITHNLGPCPRLEADTLMAIFRSVRARRFSTERMTRNNPDDTADIWGSSINPASSISDGAPSDKTEHMTIESADGTKTISLQSTDLTGEGAQVMKPREIKVIESDGATPPVLTQKKYQIMATEGAEPTTITLPEGGDLPDLNVLTSVTGFGVTQRTGGHVIFLNFGTTNLKTGLAGAEDKNDLILTEKSLVGLVSYGGTPPAFKQAMITVQTLGAAAGVTEEIVELESHASQHVEE